MEDTAGAGAPEAGGAACSRDGTTCLRQAALGANTPWKRTKWWRGGGISESSSFVAEVSRRGTVTLLPQ